MSALHDEGIRRLTWDMRYHVYMCIGILCAIVANLQSMVVVTWWAPVLFAVNVMLMRVNAGRWLVLRNMRIELVKLQKSINEVERAIKGVEGNDRE